MDWKDRLFTIGVAQAAILEKKWMPTYNYVFDHNDGFNIGTFIAATHPLADLVSFFGRFLLRTSEVKNTKYKPSVPPGTSHDMGMKFSICMHLVQLWLDFVNDKKSLKFRGIEFLPSSSGDDEDLKFLRISWKDSKMLNNDPTKEARLMWESLNLSQQ